MIYLFNPDLLVQINIVIEKSILNFYLGTATIPTNIPVSYLANKQEHTFHPTLWNSQNSTQVS
jgi:hypothetical protein